MRKYGVEHFHIELIEETDNPEEREVFWIENKRSFKNGYNATKGGDGKKYIDYDLVIATYNQVQNIYEVARLLHHDPQTIRKILNEELKKNPQGISKYQEAINYIIDIVAIICSAPEDGLQNDRLQH